MTQRPMQGGRYYRDKAGNLSKEAPAQPAVKSVSGLAPIGAGAPVDPPAGNPPANPAPADSASATATDATTGASKKGN